MSAIFKRKSVRRYLDKPLKKEEIDIIMKAAVSGPTCVNSKDWSFIVVTDKKMLNKMADLNGKPAEPLRGAALGVLICGDYDKAFMYAKDYWVVDGAIAGENMIIAATELGIGSVWLGTWPQMDRVEAQKKLFNLPDNQIPHSIIAFGYPEDPNDLKEERNDYDMSAIHYNNW
ncbi:MAG: nitroreductase family protein [Acholeplasmatales bacterium]|nr:nitroreductase family protein [Acholeplasmatales bacterium]